MNPNWDSNRKKVKDLMEKKGLDAIILTGQADIIYSTGIRDPTEVLILSKNCPDYLLTSTLDYYRMLSRAPKDIIIKAFHRQGEKGTEPPIPRGDIIDGGIQEAIKKLLSECGAKYGSDLAWSLYPIGKYLVELGVIDISDELAKVRAKKDSWEVELIEKSIEASEKALRESLEMLEEKPTEREIEGKFYSSLMSQGAWGESFPTIVAFYENTALPHYNPGSIVLERPGPVLIDFGANMEGYMSDMTRSLWFGTGGREYKKLIEIVEEAQSQAIDIIEPGIEAWVPDNASRKVFEREGILRYFNHGLGHGVGVEIHERPYLRPNGNEVLEKGMVVTVEPGIYYPGLYGVRIEDMVYITERKARIITRFSRIIY
ncbi:MAG: Xaa-Pro peptidase family protein [Caldisphaeraceae archaeon]|nr:Xaa-Pro peptidase family protein [Caldisphaeraceae archaeon]MEB3692576.1 Xaa-Pro peptidase family protein [Caldisphaeraceae archaeon]MEB3797497.1 Xaa-Pro peptidase family protein [Caldisphaeraceae archaeon]